MCKKVIIVIAPLQASKKVELAYSRKTREEILSGVKGNEKYKVDINFIDTKSLMNFYSKKGQYIGQVVFDLSGHPEEKKIIEEARRKIKKLTNANNTTFKRLCIGEDRHDCITIYSMKYASHDM